MPCGGDPTKATVGKGATFSIGPKVSTATTPPLADDAGWNVIAEVSTIEQSGITTAEEDVTNLQSPGGFGEYLATNADPGTVDITGNYIGDTSQGLLRTAAWPDTTTCRVENYYWKITNILSDGSTENRIFIGFVKTFKEASPLSNTAKVEFSAQIRRVGTTTLTTVAPAGLTAPGATAKKAA
jgi:hypothetical protein